jgi:hypothetical protein
VTEDGRRKRDDERGKMDEGRGKMDERMTKKIRTVRDLKVYRKAFDSAMEIFELTKNFPCIVIISMRILSKGLMTNTSTYSQ